MIVKVKKLNTKLLTKDKYCKEDIIVQIDQSLVSPDVPMGTAEITTTEKVNVAQYEFAQVVDNNLKAENIKKGVSILGIEGTAEGGSGGIPIEEVETLPTENIEENKIYVENKSVFDLYLVADVKIFFSELINSTNQNGNLQYYVVDSLPSEPNVSDLETFSEVHIYILNNIPYVYIDDFYKLSLVLFETEGFDKGLITDISQANEIGVYVFDGNLITYGISNAKVVQYDNANSVWINYKEVLNLYLDGELGTFYIPSDLTIIREYCFAKSGLGNIKNTDNITEIRQYAFYGNPISNAYFPLVKTMGQNAFENCQQLTSANFPMLNQISFYAFRNCQQLTTVNFPNVTSIEWAAFYSCTSLTTVNFPNVTSIESQLFYQCIALTSIYLPKVTIIKFAAFENCTKLTDIYLGYNGVVSLSNTNAFNGGASNTRLHVKPNFDLTALYAEATNWSSLIASGRITIVEDYVE